MKRYIILLGLLFILENGSAQNPSDSFDIIQDSISYHYIESPGTQIGYLPVVHDSIWKIISPIQPWPIEPWLPIDITIFTFEILVSRQASPMIRDFGFIEKEDFCFEVVQIGNHLSCKYLIKEERSIFFTLTRLNPFGRPFPLHSKNLHVHLPKGYHETEISLDQTHFATYILQIKNQPTQRRCRIETYPYEKEESVNTTPESTIHVLYPKE